MPLALSPMPAPTPSPSEPGTIPDGEAAHNEPPHLKRRSHERDARIDQQKRSEFLAWITLFNDVLMTAMTSLVTY